MHVLVTTDTVGGVWTYTQELVEGLLQRDFRITLVSLGGPPTIAQSNWAAQLTRNAPGRFRYVETSYRLEWMQDSEADIERSFQFLQETIARFRPDVLHLNQFCYGALDTPLPKLVVAHSDVLSWWKAVHGCAAPALPWITQYKSWVAAGLAGADKIVAPSAWMREQLRAFGIAEEDVDVIWNGRDPKRFRSDRPHELRAVTAGRVWDEAKNVKAVEGSLLPLPVVVAGETFPPPNAGRCGEQPSPESAVTYLGALSGDQLRELLETSAIYIAPSLYEPFGLAPLEAALCGCSVVANDLPSLREIWGDAAVSFDVNVADSLQSTLARLVSDPALLLQYRKRARSHAEANLSADRMIDAYTNLYAQVCEPAGVLP